MLSIGSVDVLGFVDGFERDFLLSGSNTRDIRDRDVLKRALGNRDLRLPGSGGLRIADGHGRRALSCRTETWRWKCCYRMGERGTIGNSGGVVA